MSGKDVGGDFCSGFPGELGRLVVLQAHFTSKKVSQGVVKGRTPETGSADVPEKTGAPQEVHSQR